jgi:hypothetical protein
MNTQTSDLRKIAAAIRREHALAVEGFKKAVPHAIKAGDLLIDAKKLVPHGRWQSWLDAHVKVSRRAARGYMQLARWRKRQPTATLEETIDGMLRKIGRRPKQVTIARKAPAGSHTIEYLPVDALKPHPLNYKNHPPDQIDHLKASIAQHGLFRNVVAARDLTILAGHGLVQAVKEMGPLGPTRVPVIRLDVGAMDPQAIKIVVTDNEVGQMAERNDHNFKTVMDKLRSDDEQKSNELLLGTGLDDMLVNAQLFAALGPRNQNEDAQAHFEAAGAPAFDGRTGVWALHVDFDSREMRDTFIANFNVEVRSANRTKHLVVAWWPPRRKHDVTSLRWVLKESDQEVQPG